MLHNTIVTRATLQTFAHYSRPSSNLSQMVFVYYYYCSERICEVRPPPNHRAAAADVVQSTTLTCPARLVPYRQSITHSLSHKPISYKRFVTPSSAQFYDKLSPHHPTSRRIAYRDTLAAEVVQCACQTGREPTSRGIAACGRCKTKT